uniref:interleukin-6 receptor subunit alpha isoform X2 n=1 Tax=Doryrhamphus excisus TaxID=161450 RepID=UPI0025AE38D3|nr:interleukin-6 receptor subunit alpha isoform X2 [Doryrhamphus excisus]
MHRFLPLLCVWLCITPVGSFFQGTCPKQEPPPGVLVVSPGSSLVLSCDGDVKVDGAKVKVSKQSSNNNTGERSSSVTQTTAEKPHRNKAFRKDDTNTMKDKRQDQGVQPTSSPPKADGMDTSTASRGFKGKWKLNGKTVGRGHWDWEGFTVGRGGTQLSVSSVQVKDSGNYSCHHRGRERFTIKVMVADPPETPRLSCSKKSPSSKIRCEWTPEKPLTLRPHCSLLLSKRPSDTFHRVPCSFSSHWSRCWCALDHDEDELRTSHMAYLCVTSVAGNATSPILSFSPLGILRPDPPAAVAVRQEVGHETRLTVNWTYPASWKSQDTYYELVYELRYQPVDSSHEQVRLIKGRRSFTITDALSGVEYMIQLRTQDEFDGLWSSWSAPVYGSSWTDVRTQEPVVLLNDDLFPEYESSGTEDEPSEVLPELSVSRPTAVSHHILWISCPLALFAVILVACVFSLSLSGRQPAPPAPIAPEGRALVTFHPPVTKEDERSEMARQEVVHYNNTHYFLAQGQ